MKKKLSILAALIVVFVIVLINSDLNKFQTVTVFKSGTKVGSIELSRTNWETGYSILTSKLSDPIYVNLENKSRGVTLKEIGFDIDKDKLSKLTKTCRTEALKLFCSNTSNEKVDPNDVISVDKDKLDSFLDGLNAEIQYLAKNNIISLEDFTFRAVTDETSVSINKDMFVTREGIANFFTEETAQINLQVNTQSNIDSQNEATKQLIEDVSVPLQIKYGRNPIYIPGDVINSFIGTKFKNGVLHGELKDDAIISYLDSLENEYGSEDVVILKDFSVAAIKRAILYRATNYEVNNAVILPLEGKPKSDGSLHDVYLEINKAQQRLYRFENGKVIKTYIISTGLTWETPPGQYQVLGKQKMTISYFGNWYMPNYLPIGTINGYRFGFHEIPYHMDGAGNIYSRDPETMGSPATGGCIQLTKTDSLEIFNWADVGTPVYIYE
jgi:lipoprotein-anchoring transpeptidase ErfK/SrfK